MEFSLFRTIFLTFLFHNVTISVTFSFLGGLECVGHSFAYVAHFVFLRDVWIRTQRAAVASRRATNLACHPSPFLATHLL
jgi:hypothetical protein